MKKNLLVFFLFAIIIACNKKAIPTIPERERQETPAKEISTMTVVPDLARGKTIFMNRCGRCHDLPKPEQYTATRWEKILSTMMPKARLNPEQEVHITAFLKENAGK